MVPSTPGRFELRSPSAILALSRATNQARSAGSLTGRSVGALAPIQTRPQKKQRPGADDPETLSHAPGGIRTCDLMLRRHALGCANHGKKSSKPLLGCTICHSCRFAMPEDAASEQRECRSEQRELERESASVQGDLPPKGPSSNRVVGLLRERSGGCREEGFNAFLDDWPVRAAASSRGLTRTRVCPGVKSIWGR